MFLFPLRRTSYLQYWCRSPLVAPLLSLLTAAGFCWWKGKQSDTEWRRTICMYCSDVLSCSFSKLSVSRIHLPPFLQSTAKFPWTDRKGTNNCAMQSPPHTGISYLNSHALSLYTPLVLFPGQRESMPLNFYWLLTLPSLGAQSLKRGWDPDNENCTSKASYNVMLQQMIDKQPWCGARGGFLCFRLKYNCNFSSIQQKSGVQLPA